MVVQFAKTDYAVEESAPTAMVEIVRRGYTDSAVSVTLNTADETATAGSDYKATSTAVAFAPGETVKQVQLRVRDDSLPERDETVLLNLNGPSPDTAPLWILDDERAGSVKPEFHFDAPLGLAWVHEVPSLEPLLGGRLLATTFGEDASANYTGMLARFKQDGSVDSHFTPYPLPYAIGPSQVTPLLGGLRLLVNLGDRVVRLHPNGREDSGFTLTVTDEEYAYISDVVAQPDFKIIIAGHFSSVNGVPRKNVARLRPSGAVDPGFDPGAGPDYDVLDAALQQDGKVVIGGYFQTVAGQPWAALARLNRDGSLDTTLDTGAGFGDSMYGIPYVQTVAIQRDGAILAGGFFDSYQGALRVGLVRLQANGALDGRFDTGTGIVSAFNPDYPGFINNLAVQPDGKVLMTGGFGYVNGVWATGIVRLNADGSLDTGAPGGRQ